MKFSFDFGAGYVKHLFTNEVAINAAHFCTVEGYEGWNVQPIIDRNNLVGLHLEDCGNGDLFPDIEEDLHEAVDLFFDRHDYAEYMAALNVAITESIFGEEVCA